MNTDTILSMQTLGSPWETSDPFLFCMYHNDFYPAGNDRLGPAVSLAGRNIGQDFRAINRWRMYHGDVVPGFPQHPHRGFETITIMRHGFIDHSDSLGAEARIGPGDVQWITVGRGIVHSEMFPLLRRKGFNPLDLFQIWLNLPSSDKFVEPHFEILWEQRVPKFSSQDERGHKTEIKVVAGRIENVTAVPPPPNSWAARPDNDVAIWRIRMDAFARFTLPHARRGTNRTVYFFTGNTVRVDGTLTTCGSSIRLRPDVDATLENGIGTAHLLLLQGRPIGEPVVQYGPFVMNTRSEIHRTIEDYRRTAFGGWPWPNPDPVRSRHEGRYAKYPDGRVERAGCEQCSPEIDS